MKSYARASPAGRLAFFLLGSHNLSMAAWGALQFGASKLRVRSACCRASRHAVRRPPSLVHSTPSLCFPPSIEPCRRRQILSYELCVLFTPSLEAAYRAHPHRGFLAGPPHAGGAAALPPVAPPPAAGEAVELWTTAALPDGDGAALPPAAPGVARVVLPVPYRLPPVPYGPGDRPWLCDVRHEGYDATGHTQEEVFEDLRTRRYLASLEEAEGD
jgi:hypothetical protein